MLALLKTFDDSNLVNDFYGTQSLNNDVECDTCLTNDDVFDKLLIILRLEYQYYLAP